MLHVQSTQPADVPLLFVVPFYNEEQNLPRLLADLEGRQELFAAPATRVYLVDDGSRDGSADLLTAYEGPLPLELIRHESNLGPGAAFQTGFAAVLARCPDHALVITLEADTTSDLDALPAMLALAQGGADLVLASVHLGGGFENVGVVRRTLSRGAAFVVRRALGVDAHTVSSFFRVYRASTLRLAMRRYDGRLIEEKGFACMAEVLAKLVRAGARVAEHPVRLDGARRMGESKMAVLPTLLGYARLLLRARREPSAGRGPDLRPELGV